MERTSRSLFGIGRCLRDSSAQQNWPGKKGTFRQIQVIPVYIEGNIFNLYPSKEVKSTETNIVNNSQQVAEQCARMSNENSLLVKVDEVRSDKDEEPLETGVPRARMHPLNPMSREKQEHEDSEHAVYRIWCAACVERRRDGGQHRIEQKERLPLMPLTSVA